MPQYRKPRTKSQKQISNDLVNPYIDPETGEPIGNPNEKTSFEQFTPTEQSGVEFNRSEKLSFKGDTTKPFSIGIQDIDESVFYYFENVIKPFVHQNGVRIPVPLIYGAPEKWKSVQKDGYYKDKNGKIMSPIIVFKRDNIENNRSITNKLDANSPHLYTSWQKAYNPKNSYSNFDVLNNRIPVKQFVANVVPDYITLTYSFIIQTYYVEQLNKIIEAINYSSNSYWGDPERFKFKANIGGFAITTELNQDDDRVVRSTFTLTMYGYVVPDVLQKDVTAIKKYNSKSKITIGLETVDSISKPPIKSKPYSPIFIDGQICEPVQIYRNGILIETVSAGGIYEYITDAYTYSITNSLGGVLYSGTLNDNFTQIITNSTVENSDASYSESVLAQGSLELPDTTYNVYVNSVLNQTFSIPTLKNETINITA